MRFGQLRFQIGRFGKGARRCIQMFQVVLGDTQVIKHFRRAGFQFVDVTEELTGFRVLPVLGEQEGKIEKDLCVLGVCSRDRVCCRKRARWSRRSTVATAF